MLLFLDPRDIQKVLTCIVNIGCKFRADFNIPKTKKKTNKQTNKQNKTNKTKQNKTKSKTKENKTKNKTKQNKIIGQNKIIQHTCISRTDKILPLSFLNLFCVGLFPSTNNTIYCIPRLLHIIFASLKRTPYIFYLNQSYPQNILAYHPTTLHQSI